MATPMFKIDGLWSGFPSLYFLAFGVSLLAFTTYSLYVAFFSPLSKFPGPLSARFSNLYLLREASRGRNHLLFPELHAKYGSIVRTGPNRLLFGHPDAVPVIYGTNSKFYKGHFYTAFRRNFQGRLMDNVFTTRDPIYHKQMKTSAASVYSLSSLKQMEALVDGNTSLFIKSMEAKAGRPVDLSGWLQWYAIDVIGSITFLQTFGCMETESDAKGVISMVDFAFQYGTVVGMMPKLHHLLLGSRYGAKFFSFIPFLAKANHYNHVGLMTMKGIKDYDARNDEEKASSPDLLSAMRQAQKNHPDRLTDRDLMGFLFANIVAGSDTTAVALRCIFYSLARNPDVYAKLVAEIRNAERDGKLSTIVTYQEAMAMRYLNAVIKEALRIHPGAALPLERIVPPEGAEICGAFIPGGTDVGVSSWVVNHDEDVFAEDPHKFRPERWLEADQDQLRLMDRTFFTFGGGSRICLGKNISMLEMTKFIPQVLRKFKLEWAYPNTDWEIETYFVAKQRGLNMRLIPIKAET
ncbi:hypothetical protein MMC13_006091 [Lambiella insularis]|nr:hypothetical protein [Lambiella insularis]